MLKDANYSTPQDHYFSYIQKKKTEEKGEEELTHDVIKGLDLEPEVATKVMALKTTRDESDEELKERLHKQELRLKKHNNIVAETNLTSLVKITDTKRKVARFDEQSDMQIKTDQMMKLAPKKKQQMAADKRAEKRQQDKEIATMLKTPQNMEAEKLVQYAQDSNFEAKDLSKRDIKRLRRLQKKAAATAKAQEESGEVVVE